MKYISLIIFLLGLSTQLSQAATTQSAIITDTVHVEGNCNMCKDRIENAALIKGVKKAVWDKQNHRLIVIYDSSKTSLEKILKAVAEAGHDNEKFKAPDSVYNRLPKCCAYRGSGAHIH